jgi:hypothetical protein
VIKNNSKPIELSISWRLATTSVGGRLSIALNPNQGFSAVGVRKHSKTQSTSLVFLAAI